MNTTTTTPQTPRKEFAGDQKHLVHFLVPYEQRFLKALLPLVPLQVGTAQLTLMTLAWSAGIIIAGFLAASNPQWLWAFSACIFLQYVTDMLDGAVGRARKTGLIKWGFYMDHFLDYVFLSSIIIGYSFMLPVSYSTLVLLCLACSAGFMVHVFLDFSITNDFKISCNQFGVSEMRWVLIIFNTILVFTGTGLLAKIFPFFVATAFMALCYMVYTSQKVYSHIDAIRQSREEMDLNK